MITKHLHPGAQLTADTVSGTPVAAPSLFQPLVLVMCCLQPPSGGSLLLPLPATQIHSTIKVTLQTVIFFLIFNQYVSRKNKI